MTDTACPEADRHQWHPTGYIQHSAWADDALKVATQRRCPGCDRWEIWIPKHPDLRLRDADWNGPVCALAEDGKRCTREAICWRRFTAVASDPPTTLWLPVCYRHTSLTTVRAGEAAAT